MASLSAAFGCLTDPLPPAPPLQETAAPAEGARKALSQQVAALAKDEATILELLNALRAQPMEADLASVSSSLNGEVHEEPEDEAALFEAAPDGV